MSRMTRYSPYGRNAKGIMEPDAKGNWVTWDDFASSRLNIKQMKKDMNDAEEREAIAADAAVKYLDRIEATEAKLAKAVGALQAAKEYIDDLEWIYGGGALPTGNKYYTVLAELEGGSEHHKK
jgi:hypothetical protein